MGNVIASDRCPAAAPTPDPKRQHTDSRDSLMNTPTNDSTRSCRSSSNTDDRTSSNQDGWKKHPPFSWGSVASISIGSLELHDFIASTVVQFLGVRSLVRFGATCKSHGVVVSREVVRRKKRITTIEVEVIRLMDSRSAAPPRENVIVATELATRGKLLIDDEIEWIQEKIYTMGLICDNNSYEDSVKDGDFDLFFQERKKFLEGTPFRKAGSLYILPLCFYVPIRGELSNLSEEAIRQATRLAWRVWDAEDLMQCAISHFGYHDWVAFYRLDCGHPFRKFHLPGAELFVTFMEEVAHSLVRHGGTDAFRIAAREVLLEAPESRDCLWYTLERADAFEQHEYDVQSNLGSIVDGIRLRRLISALLGQR